jgi:hypothetical protein
MSVVKNKATAEDQKFWSHVESVAQEVSKWPRWMQACEPKVVEDPEQPCGDQGKGFAKAS